MTEITPEIQAQLDEQKKNCPFCKIISGELSSNKIFSDKVVTGILDINPCVKGHVLLLSNNHFPMMPLLPVDIFKHMFGILPEMIDAMKKAMLTTGANVFIANGGIAGQQAPHFLIHLLPREEGDKIYNFAFDSKKDLNDSKLKEANVLIAQNLPIMMQNHFTRNPAKWHDGKIERANFISEEVLYEDEKAVCVFPKNPQCVGHLMIYSQEEESLFEKLSFDSSAHLFYLASFASTAVFEGLKAQGTNIILKSGISEDNPTGKLCLHVFPRYQEDGLDVICKPLSKKSDLASIAKKIKDKTFSIGHSLKKEEKKVVKIEEEVIKIGESKSKLTAEEEIKKAIEDMKNS